MSEHLTTKADRNDESQLVTFYLGEEEFGFNIMSVQEIIRQPHLSRIPLSPPYIEGIANLRGMILPIIDTRTRFGMTRAEDTDRTRVLVVDVDGNKTGLRVDRVRQVTRVQRQQMESPPPVIRAGMSADYLAGVVKLDNGKRIILTLNPRSVCQVSADQLQGKAAVVAATDETDVGPKKAAGVDQSVAQLVTFKLGDAEFAFHLEAVREILRVERPSEVPDTPKHVLGVLTVRGAVLPVIDLRVMLGLDNLETEVVAEAAQLGTRVAAWLAEVRPGAGGVDARGPESVRKWLAGYATTSEALMEITTQIRNANDRLLRGVTQALSATGVASELAATHLQNEVEAPARQVLKLLEKFKESVKENIREDQRLVVVQARGTLLALLVDKVREVLKMPKGQIDPPLKTLAETQNVELAGIAKLDNGKRLILLLNPENLVKEQELQALGAATDVASANLDHAGPTAAQGGVRREEQFVTFRLGDVEYGVPISKVQEIDRSSKMTRVPRSPEHMDGITNLRGEIIPVINARKRFNLPQKPVDERSRVIIMEAAGVKTGLLVDSVREVLNIAHQDIAPPPASLSHAIDRQFISGIGKINGDKRMLVLLDVDQVLKG